MGKLFGGSKQKAVSESGNKAYPFLQDTFGGTAGLTGQSGNAIAALLGLGGDPAAQTGALENFSKSAGMDFVMDQGSRAITGNHAAKGLLNSGATLKALNTFGQGVGSTYLNQYLDNMFKLSNTGLQAGGLIGNAGQYSNSTQTSKSKPGLGGLLGAGLSLIPGIGPIAAAGAAAS